MKSLSRLLYALFHKTNYNIYQWISIYLIFYAYNVITVASNEINPYDRSILPNSLPDYHIPNATYKKYIPRIIWMAVKDRK